ncbi:MAG: hypothetical protein HY833_03655 [Candidatus Aenigmarchaeota archaeon]|nr:hypothetical protein [Candidatus Aenigmarchaeota archaeon]
MKGRWDYVPDEEAAAAIIGAIADNFELYSYFSRNKNTKIGAARDPSLKVPMTSLYRNMDALQRIGMIVATGDREASDGRPVKVYASAFDRIEAEINDAVGMKIALSEYGRRNPSLIVSERWARPIIGDLRDRYDMSEGTVSYRGSEFYVLNTGKFDSTDKKWSV